MTEVLNISQLSVALQGKDILSGLTLSLNKGDILGLVGASGCGKTTFLNTLAGFIEHSSGKIVIEKKLVITPKTPVAPEQRNIGMIFQDYALFPHLSVEKNICFGLKKLPAIEQKQRMDDLLALLNLTSLKARYPHQLSGGQQQRVAIARALAPRPKLLLLDEPFSNIDGRLRNTLMVEMRKLLKQLNISAIFVTHNKDEVFAFADQIAVMHHGVILQKDTPSLVCEKPNSWQVADFLQLGSWLPLQKKTESSLGLINNVFVSALGDVTANFPTIDKTDNKQLLLKSKYVDLNCVQASVDQANCVIEHIAVTEHGYRYLLSSINDAEGLAFKQLNVYSPILFSLGDKVCAKVIKHNYQLFSE